VLALLADPVVLADPLVLVAELLAAAAPAPNMLERLLDALLWSCARICEVMPAIIVKSLPWSCDLRDRRPQAAWAVPTQVIENVRGADGTRQILPGVSCRAGTGYAQRHPAGVS
jgi:hypothetical protein